MFFTGAGDDGQTNLFGCSKRLSKDDAVIEALGTVDELNSLLGISRAKAEEISQEDKNFVFSDFIRNLQEDLFIIQAELAGAEKSIGEERIEDIEKVIHGIEKELPPIENFIISGENLLSAHLDYARSVSRRMERRIVSLEKKHLSPATLKYCNRLSSMLYALARLAAKRANAKEQSPSYLRRRASEM